MANEIIGTVTCPHCGNPEATVHREARGKRALYYRCYSSRGGAEMRCGTVQIRGPKGQEWIERNMHGEQPAPANDPIAPEPTPAEPANDPIAEPTPKPVPRQRSSVFGRLIESMTQEED